MHYDLARPEALADAGKLALASRGVFRSSDRLRRPIESLPRQIPILRADFRNLQISDSSTQAISSWPNVTLLDFEDCELDLSALNEQQSCPTCDISWPGTRESGAAKSNGQLSSPI